MTRMISADACAGVGGVRQATSGCCVLPRALAPASHKCPTHLPVALQAGLNRALSTGPSQGLAGAGRRASISGLAAHVTTWQQGTARCGTLGGDTQVTLPGALAPRRHECFSAC